MKSTSTILIVNDEQAVHQTLKELLAPEGYDLTFASNGADALTTAAKLVPDLILLDAIMPDMDGFEVCRHLRAAPLLAEVPVVMVTDLNDRDARVQSIKAGADDVVSKPFDELELRARVRTTTQLGHYRRLLLEQTQRRQTEKTLHRRNRELALLNRAGQAFNSTLDLNQVLATVLEEVRHLMDVTACSIWLLDPETNELVCRQAAGLQSDTVRGWRLAAGDGLAGWVIRSGESLIAPDVQADERHFVGVDRQTGVVSRSVLGVPLRVKRETIGVIEIVDAKVGRFKPTDLELAEPLAAAAATAIENARLYRDLQDQMEELKRTQTQLIQSAKMAAIGELAAGVAHELNNPLTVVLGLAELLLRDTAPDDAMHKDLTTIVAQAIRTRDIVRGLLDFARHTEFRMAKDDVNEVIDETLALFRQHMESSGIDVQVHYATDLPFLLLDAGRMKQVFLNLITNATHAMPRGGTLTVTSKRVGDEVAVRVADTGEGISAEHLSRIFDPFFTTKPVGQGTGLGLSVSQSIVQDHGGRIEVASRPGEGSTFTVWLPIGNISADDEGENHEQ